MNIDGLIKEHNEALNRQAEANPFLKERIKSDLKRGDRLKIQRPGRLIKNPLFIYSLLLIAFTALNLLVINGLHKPKTTPQPTLTASMQPLQASYPGSISHAYKEVMK